MDIAVTLYLTICERDPKHSSYKYYWYTLNEHCFEQRLYGSLLYTVTRRRIKEGKYNDLLQWFEQFLKLGVANVRD